MRPVSRGNRGKEVVDIQTRLSALGYFLGREGADGFFGPHTEAAARQFQQVRLLLADGVIGDNTWTELVEAGHSLGERLLYLRIPPMRGDDVLALQRQLNELGFDSGPEDGIFGSHTENALTEFQRNAGVNVDAIVGEATLEHLRRIGKSPAALSEPRKIPDRLDGYVRRDTLAGLRVSLDAAHGGRDLGGRGLEGLVERDCNLLLARELAVSLAAAGADVLLVRDGDRAMGLYDRTRAAAAWRPDLHLCVHHDHHADPRASGAATFYFANGAYFSESGKRLAGYVVQALVEELGRIDLHTHGRNYACLREPECLALMVECAFITGSADAPGLAAPGGLHDEAAAIVHGIRSYLARS
jgi:N-acetylmuramoyl-L-alanine amidase